MIITGWHFAGARLRDGRPLPKKGETIRHEGAVIPCKAGLHGSARAIDALEYAPSCMVARVQLSGVVVPHGKPVDKYAASERTNITDYVDCRNVIVARSRQWALRAVRVHAAGALRAAGLIEEADKLAALPDDVDLVAASGAAAASRAAANVSSAADYASWAADASNAADYASSAADYASRAVAYASNAADYASRAAAYASRVADYASRADADAIWAADRDLHNRELEAELSKLVD